MRDFIEAVNYVFIVYFVLLNGSYLLMSVVAIRTLARHARRKRRLHLHEQSASGTVMARTDLYTEFFHSPGLGWEFSVGYRRADYAQSGANTWMIGAAKYVGNWYVRIRPSATQVVGTFGYALMGTIRRYFGRPDEHIGLMVARGREIVAFPSDAGIRARNSLSGSLSYQRDLRRSTGVRLGVEGVRDGDLSRWGFTTGVLWRW